MYGDLGIEKGIILPEINPECASIIQSSEDAYFIAQKYPDNFYWFCNLNPHMGGNNTQTDFSFYLNYYKSLGAKGVGEVVANMYFDDPLMDNLLYHCAECDMPVIFHIATRIGGCYGIVDDIGLTHMETILKKYPKLKLIGHSQPFWAEISSDVTEQNRGAYPQGKVTEGRLSRLFREYDNIYGDLSAGSGYNAITRDPEFGYRFLEEFSDRLMFGTDICSPSNDMRLSRWLDTAMQNNLVSYGTYKKVSRDNAIRLLKL
jgi:predicted TIM-barrel fold metal-dependent hydrolase